MTTPEADNTTTPETDDVKKENVEITTPEGKAFADVSETHRAFDAVKYVSGKGLMNMYQENKLQ